jgi:enhancing lycopene biosynthesis protein 2
MNVLRQLFTEHPASVNETYGQHFANAMGFGLRMIAGGFVCIVHALIPGVFCKTASGTIGELHDRMVVNRHRLSQPDVSAETRRAA